MPLTCCPTYATSARVARGVLRSQARLTGLETRPALALTTAHRFHTSSTSSPPPPPPPSSPYPTVPRDNTGKSGRIIDTPAPPRPAFYVPPQERAADDESLAFMEHPDSPLRAINEAHRRRLAQEQAGRPDEPHAALTQGRDEAGLAVGTSDGASSTVVSSSPAAAPLGPGQKYAPSLAEQEQPKRRFMDADAERLQSTSVHAGQSLLKGKNIDSADFVLPPRKGHATARTAAAGSGPAPDAAGAEANFAAHAARPRAAPKPGQAASAGGGTMFCSKLEDASLEDLTQDPGRAKVAADAAATAAQKPRRRQLEEDIKKLEYYYGSPQYAEMLKAFQDKYGKEQGQGGDGATEDSTMGAAERAYSSEDLARGLDSQPVDYLRSSSKLQSHLTSGPHAYDPITVMQQHGLMRFQGYAFPPTVELGKLKGVEDYKALQETHKENALVKKVRQSFNALMHRQSDKDDFLATEPKEKGDTSLVYRTVGLDAVQRRQMRFMLTDFDYADRHTAFHVMMSYPYTDWLHAFYMVLVGWALYQLQLKYNAYDFYDEYLGLDLRQVPSLKKPLLIAITCSVMVFLLFQPLLVASIATNRAYRIVTRRPIGPP